MPIRLYPEAPLPGPRPPTAQAYSMAIPHAIHEGCADATPDATALRKRYARFLDRAIASAEKGLPSEHARTRLASMKFAAQLAAHLIAASEAPSPTAGMSDDERTRATIIGAASLPEGQRVLADLGYAVLPSDGEAKR